jgi:MFS family permease
MAKALSRKEKIRTIFLSSVGGGLEFYDFVIFAIFAAVIGKNFFPDYSPIARLIGTYAVFAIGYLVRPIGGIIFSHYGDKYGRKKSFSVSISTMAAATLLMSIVPNYEQGGLTCTIIFVFLRLLQGMSIGGEIPGAITFLSEHIKDRPGAACGIIIWFLNIGILLADGIYALLHLIFTEPQLIAYGWRLAFLFGGLLAVVSFYLRQNLKETPQFLEQDTFHKAPFLVVIKKYPFRIISGFFITGLTAAIVTLYLLYLTPYMQDVLHMDDSTTTYLSLYQLLIFIFFSPFFSVLSDYTGRRILLLFASLLVIVTAPLFFMILKSGHYLYWLMTVNGIVISIYTGSFPCLMSEIFPVDVRFSGLAFSYNLGFAIFGGLTPLIASVIIQQTHLYLAPAFILIFSGICAFISLLFIKTERL